MTAENASHATTFPSSFQKDTACVLSVTWDSARGILDVRCAGIPDERSVKEWRAELWNTVKATPLNQKLRVLVDLTGYEVDAVPRDVHFAQRTVIPELFAAHGFLAGYLNLYAEKPELQVGPENRRIVRCATVHHDQFKMESYQRMFGRADDAYFTARSEAETWLTGDG